MFLEELGHVGILVGGGVVEVIWCWCGSALSLMTCGWIRRSSQPRVWRVGILRSFCMFVFLTNHGAFVIVLKTLFWNICSFFKWVCAHLSQIRQAYVITGRSICLYISRESFFCSKDFLFKIGKSIPRRW